MAATDTVTHQQDLDDILALHTRWLYSNNGLVIDEMAPNFADPGYLQFNLNGHTYNGLAEKIKLWHGFHSIDFDLADMGFVEDPIVYADGDLGYVTAIWKATVIGTDSSGLMKPDPEPVVFRVTEVYRRDDGNGNPIWKIWHFHASPVAPADSIKFPQDAQ
jgi:ketosteroid isomerase-like protein